MTHLILLILHIMGVAVGAGGAVASDPLFLSSIRNRRISSDQLVLLHVVSRVVLAGLGLVILSGIGLVLLHPHLLQDGTFLAKMTIVFVIAVNGSVFHARVLPVLEEHVDEKLNEETLSEELPLLAVSGALSSVSWFSALTLGVLLHFPLPYLLLINIYLVAAAGAVIAAYLVITHIVFTPQPEPEEVLESEKFPRAMKWLPGILAAVVLGIIGFGAAVILGADIEPPAVVDGDHDHGSERP